MKSQVLHTVWCNISGEAAGEIVDWSLLGVKGLNVNRSVWISWYWYTEKAIKYPWTFWVFFVLFFCLARALFHGDRPRPTNNRGNQSLLPAELNDYCTLDRRPLSNAKDSVHSGAWPSQTQSQADSQSRRLHLANRVCSPNATITRSPLQIHRNKVQKRNRLLLLTLSLPRVINFKFPQPPKRNITSHSMENMAFYSFTQMKDNYTTPPILTSYLIHFSRLGECTFFNLRVKGLMCGSSGDLPRAHKLTDKENWKRKHSR